MHMGHNGFLFHCVRELIPLGSLYFKSTILMCFYGSIKILKNVQGPFPYEP